MCKRNYPDENEASTGCVRETPQIKRERETKKEEEKTNKQKNRSQHGICKRNSPDKKKKKSARDV